MADRHFTGVKWTRREILARAAGTAAGSTLAGWPAPDGGDELADRQADGGRAIVAANNRPELRLERG
jgi:hypothetical protein